MNSPQSEEKEPVTISLQREGSYTQDGITRTAVLVDGLYKDRPKLTSTGMEILVSLVQPARITQVSELSIHETVPLCREH